VVAVVEEDQGHASLVREEDDKHQEEKRKEWVAETVREGGGLLGLEEMAFGPGGCGWPGREEVSLGG
jgi:hypothetical protein